MSSSINGFEPPQGFSLVEITNPISEKDLKDLANVVVESLLKEPLFLSRLPGLTPDQRKLWSEKNWIRPALDDETIRLFAVRDDATSRLVAYTGLQFPSSDPAHQEATKSRQAEVMRSLPPTGQEFLKLFAGSHSSVAQEHGYDPTLHFHKRNTLCLPEYHGRGIGAWMTAYCDQIADEAGQPTYVLARPKAWKMLERRGYVLLQTIVLDLAQFGWPGDTTTKLYRRSAKPSSTN